MTSAVLTTFIFIVLIPEGLTVPEIINRQTLIPTISSYIHLLSPSFFNMAERDQVFHSATAYEMEIQPTVLS